MRIWSWLLIILFVSAPSATFAAKRSKLSKDEKNWLKMVDFIITNEERVYFSRKLKDRYERQRYIELFWAKRDPDLTDGVNPFREEYLARYDYVMTHFEKTGRHKIPKDERSYIYMLLGPPQKTEPRIDITLMGTQFRNRFFQHPPELWIYTDVDYNYRRKKLKVQMIPTTTFGDFVAYTENYSTNWLRTLKYKFIVNPDLEYAPLAVEEGEQFRGVVDLRRDPKPQPAAPETAPTAKVETAPAATPLPTPPAPPREIKAQPEADMSKPDVIPSAQPEPESVPLTTPPTQTNLSVPATVTPDNAESRIDFKTDAPNDLNVSSQMGYFMGGSGRTLLLARIGFPLEKLDYTFSKNQFAAPFLMEYSLTDMDNNQLAADSLESEVRVPTMEAVKKDTANYSRELAVILDPGRYRLSTQVSDPRAGKLSYHEVTIEIPPLDRAGITTTQLVFMDPNVDPNTAKFNINGKPFAMRLHDRHGRKDRVYPVIEIIGKPSPDALDSITMHAIRDGEKIHSWVLYPEEMTPTNHGSILVHPELRIHKLLPGAHKLQFEMELASGSLLLSETDLTVER